jgi:surfeit locus 1 family protein
MRLRSLAVAVLVLAAASVCVKLGLWQLSRLAYKRRLNASMRQALAQPPWRLVDPRALPDSLVQRRVAVHGVFDERRQILLVGRSHDGEPGVHVVTPLVTDRDSVAVLVDRGWLPADDAATARPQDFAAPGPRDVVGIADSLRRGGRGDSVRTLAADSVTLYSAVDLDADALARRFPYALAPFYVRELPSVDAPRWPAREPPAPFEETLHLSYAIQWFAMATILVVGSVAVARSRHGRSRSAAAGESRAS